MSLFIAPLKEAREIAHQFDAVITIEHPGFEDGLRLSTNQLVLVFEDLDIEEQDSPSAADVRAAIEFARRFADGRLLVHCQAGQARSPAIALAILADRLGPGAEEQAVAALLRIRADDPQRTFGPNLEVLRHADELLDRGGKLVEAWQAVEVGDERLARFRFLREVARVRFGR